MCHSGLTARRLRRRLNDQATSGSAPLQERQTSLGPSLHLPSCVPDTTAVAFDPFVIFKKFKLRNTHKDENTRCLSGPQEAERK